MDIVLHPRGAPSDRLRIWLGLFNCTAAPGLAWTLDGVPTQPVTLRQLQSVRTDGAGGMVAADEPRVFSGIFEFSGCAPDRFYTVGVNVGGQSCSLRARTLPAAVPSGVDEWFNVLLVSCFHAAEDRAGLAGSTVAQLQGKLRPHLTLLLGDQVYLDLPTLQEFDDDTRWLAAKFERDYATNWHGPTGYGQVLAAAPSISIPDDHEFWNNYPHASPFIGNTWKEAGRARWRQAARMVYESFQQPWPVPPGEATILDVVPLSFFLADTRTFRAEDRARTMNAAEHQQFRDWINHVKGSGLYGIFVSGQSLFENPAKELGGQIGDYAFANYGDYGDVARGLTELVEAGRPVLCITGDVHWGRVTRATDMRRSGRTSFYEVISSPASLVTTVGQDQISAIGAFFSGLFGKRDPWPRHSDAGTPPEFLAFTALQNRFPTAAVHRQKGNHVALLSFRQNAGGVQWRVSYYAIHSDRAYRLRSDIGPFSLTPLSMV